MTDYHYRIIALSQTKVKSVLSHPVVARATDISIPEPPDWTRNEWVSISETEQILPYSSNVGRPAIRLSWGRIESHIKIKVQRKNKLNVWIDASDWIESTQINFTDTSREINITTNQTFRLLLLGQNGRNNQIFKELTVLKIQ